MTITDKLLNQIKETRDIDKFLNNNTTDFTDNNFAANINRLLEEKGISKADVIKESNLSRTYAYSFFSGDRRPNRNNVLQLCFGLGLTFDETQSLLKASEFSPLYARNPRDSVIIFALNNKMNIIDANELLDNHDMEILE